MSDLANGKVTPADGTDPSQVYKRDFWSKENLKHARRHFRLEKSARILRGIARDRQVDLLDVGCGPATLMSLLPDSMHYYGIDIAIHDQAPNLREADFLETPIGFDGRTFDLVVAQGVFEYVGKFQLQKFAEIHDILKPDGRFIVTYTNFGHRQKEVYFPYSNVQPLDQFRAELSQYFSIERSFPASHNWQHGQPTRPLAKALNRRVSMSIPLVSPMLAVEYFFVCAPRATRKSADLTQPGAGGLA